MMFEPIARAFRTAPTAAEALAELYATPRKHGALQVAERSMATARRARGEVQARLREALATRAPGEAPIPAGPIEADLAEADAAVDAARRALAAERAKLAEVVAARLSAAEPTARTTLAGLVDDLEAAVAPIAAMHDFAVTNGVAVGSRTALAAPGLLQRVRDLRVALGGS